MMAWMRMKTSFDQTKLGFPQSILNSAQLLKSALCTQKCAWNKRHDQTIVTPLFSSRSWSLHQIWPRKKMMTRLRCEETGAILLTSSSLASLSLWVSAMSGDSPTSATRTAGDHSWSSTLYQWPCAESLSLSSVTTHTIWPSHPISYVRGGCWSVPGGGRDDPGGAAVSPAGGHRAGHHGPGLPPQRLLLRHRGLGHLLPHRQPCHAPQPALGHLRS